MSPRGDARAGRELTRHLSATALAIVCFCIHDVINIVALTIFGVVHAVDDGFTYAESYWMTAAATGERAQRRRSPPR